MTYSLQFLKAWGKYPHCKKPYRSGKAASWVVWKRLVLDKSKYVLEWIEADIGVGGRHGAPGFQVWLKRHDFSAAPVQFSQISQWGQLDVWQDAYPIFWRAVQCLLSFRLLSKFDKIPQIRIKSVAATMMPPGPYPADWQPDKADVEACAARILG